MTTILQLTHKQVVDLAPSAPFDFDATMHKPDGSVRAFAKSLDNPKT